jgi:hypothetical protein
LSLLSLLCGGCAAVPAASFSVSPIFRDAAGALVTDVEGQGASGTTREPGTMVTVGSGERTIAVSVVAMTTRTVTFEVAHQAQAPERVEIPRGQTAEVFPPDVLEGVRIQVDPAPR